MLFYIFVIRISVLRPYSAEVAWGLLTYLIVVLAEEFYFRGILYGFIEKRFSARKALIVTSIVFGLFHARQGLTGILSRTFTGWLWGTVRYSSGMIFLLIFPIHFAFNSMWLLFEGNWNNPPAWAVYALPAVEFLLGLVIVTIKNRRTK
jgi:membrane protease YdiL (CAAX protease family)